MGDGSARLGFGWVWILLVLDSVVFWAPLSLGLGGIGLLARFWSENFESQINALANELV